MTDRLRLFYYPAPPLLYGHIRLFSSRSSPRQSAPFIISNRIDDKTTVVYGSVYNLLGKLVKLLDDVDKTGPAMDRELKRRKVIPARTVDQAGTRIVELPNDDASNRAFHEYTAALEKHLLLLALYSRILFEIVTRLGKRKIRVYNYEREPTGRISLGDVSDLFLHHRYFYVDGEFIKDISTDRRSMSDHFMGGQLNWREYVKAVRDSVHSVRVRDLTKRMASIMARLSGATPQERIVFLVQNMEALTRIMSEKLTDPRYQGMLSVYFDEMVETARRADIEVSARIKAGGKVVTKEEVVFTRPRFRIHELLARRSIDVVMRRSIAFDGRPVTGPKLEEHATTIGYKTFFGRVNRLFGDDKLLENAV